MEHQIAFKVNQILKNFTKGFKQIVFEASKHTISQNVCVHIRTPVLALLHTFCFYAMRTCSTCCTHHTSATSEPTICTVQSPLADAQCTESSTHLKMETVDFSKAIPYTHKIFFFLLQIEMTNTYIYRFGLDIRTSFYHTEANLHSFMFERTLIQ